MTTAAYDPGLSPLLAKAAGAYRRHDDALFRSLLEEAIRRAPYRVDLRFNLAHHHIQIGQPGVAVEIFQRLARSSPRDVETLTCLAHWLRFAGEEKAAETVRLRLAGARPERASDLAWLWEAIDARLARKVTDSLPDLAGAPGPVAVVTLGYVLNPDGSMQPELTARLEKTLEAADAFPDASLIMSGGVPRSGRVEAVEMRDWLAARGVDPDRILMEGYSRDVVENIVYSRHILDQIGAAAVLIVTAAENVRRAGAAMDIHARVNGSEFLVPAATAASGSGFDSFADDGRDRLKLYRDALRAYGIPMMRTFPELVEL